MMNRKYIYRYVSLSLSLILFLPFSFSSFDTHEFNLQIQYQYVRSMKPLMQTYTFHMHSHSLHLSHDSCGLFFSNVNFLYLLRHFSCTISFYLHTQATWRRIHITRAYDFSLSFFLSFLLFSLNLFSCRFESSNSPNLLLHLSWSIFLSSLSLSPLFSTSFCHMTCLFHLCVCV